RRSFGLDLECLEHRTLRSTLMVTNTLDHGPGSLRDTIASAASGDGIIFDATLQGQTITLTTGELTITTSLDIHGPPGNPVVISGNDASGVCDVTNSSAVVGLFGLTITHASPLNGDGSGIDNAGTMTVSRCSLNANSGHGGGIHNAGTMTVSACNVDGN